jgi:hypothetical protein
LAVHKERLREARDSIGVISLLAAVGAVAVGDLEFVNVVQGVLPRIGNIDPNENYAPVFVVPPDLSTSAASSRQGGQEAQKFTTGCPTQVESVACCRQKSST